MTKAFVPELGQIAHGQTRHPYAVPDIMEAVFLLLAEDLERVRWNIHQQQFPSPFANHGSAGNFDSDVFSVQAYSWNEQQLWNFRCGDLKVSWYKQAGRGMSSNKPITPEMAAEVLDTCRKHLEEIDRRPY